MAERHLKRAAILLLVNEVTKAFAIYRVQFEEGLIASNNGHQSAESSWASTSLLATGPAEVSQRKSPVMGYDGGLVESMTKGSARLLLHAFLFPLLSASSLPAALPPFQQRRHGNVFFA